MSTSPAEDWTYDSIVRGLHERRILLRVHTSPSSPLLGSHNDAGSAGFTARNLAFRGLTGEQYAEATAGLRYDRGWAEGPYMRQVIIDHVNNTTPRLNVPPPHHQRGLHRHHVQRMNEDDLTPWISTTGSLDWAIWDIARLLTVMGHKRVRLAIIDATRTPHTRGGELRVRPFHYRPKSEWISLSRKEKDKYLRASWAAGDARETLYYGRIFGESVLADLAFDPLALPFALPEHYFNPPRLRDHTRKGWLAWLQWHPALLNFKMAMQKINRRLAVGKDRYRQPVNSALQTHRLDQPRQAGISELPETLVEVEDLI